MILQNKIEDFIHISTLTCVKHCWVWCLNLTPLPCLKHMFKPQLGFIVHFLLNFNLNAVTTAGDHQHCCSPRSAWLNFVYWYTLPQTGNRTLVTNHWNTKAPDSACCQIVELTALLIINCLVAFRCLNGRSQDLCLTCV